MFCVGVFPVEDDDIIDTIRFSFRDVNDDSDEAAKLEHRGGKERPTPPTASYLIIMVLAVCARASVKRVIIQRKLEKIKQRKEKQKKNRRLSRCLFLTRKSVC